MNTWYCNQCNKIAEYVDADTHFLEFEGMQECVVCETCKEWWFEGPIVKKIVKGEADCQAKME